jgi:cystathionine beta-lyase/cystathionine gamma-synthase
MGKPIKLGEEEACLLGTSNLNFPCPPSTPPIVPAAVYACESTSQAESLLGGQQPGYVYQRDGHPNADWLAEKCRKLHAADAALMTSSGMAALSSVLLAHVQSGDRIVISDQLYGRTTLVFGSEARRLGIQVSEVDITDLSAVEAALKSHPRLLLAETISNPLTRMANLPELAKLTQKYSTLLVVDNTFATPMGCRPLELGADLVVESVSKLMNGHGDLMLGLIAGKREAWERIPQTVAAWGFASSPFDCWLAERGLATLGLRVPRACENAQTMAEFLIDHPAIDEVIYPGLPHHPDHQLAQEWMLSERKQPKHVRFGHILSFHLRGDSHTVDRLIRATQTIEFCPSLGEVRTTLSHPASTSHRSMTETEREKLGIRAGTVRLSLGIESSDWLVEQLRIALDSLDLKADQR